MTGVVARLRRAWLRLVAFVDEREDPVSIALARILVGLAVLCHLAYGLITGNTVIAWTRAGDHGLAGGDGWLAMIGGATHDHVVVVCVVGAVAAAGVVLGAFTRPSLFVAWLCWHALTALNREAAGSYDGLITDILVPLFFSGCGRALSVDAWRRPQPSTVARWPRYLLIAQLALLYGGTALMKASSSWVPGGGATALWFILHLSTWTRYSVDALPTWLYPVTQLATTTTWFFELAGPLFALAVVWRERNVDNKLSRFLERIRFRPLWLAYGIALHLGIELMMEVGPFLPATLALYCAAIAPASWRAVFARFRRP